MIDGPQQVLFVSPFFYPELISTGKANQHLAEAFVASGYAVTVICSHPLYPAWKPEPSEAQLPGMKILRGGLRVRYPRAMPLRRLLLEAWFAMYAALRVRRQLTQPQLVLSVLPPSLFAYALHRIFPSRVRRVAVVHDLQGVLAAQKQSWLRRVIIRMIHAVESRAFRSQDLCIFFSEDMARAAQQSYQLDSAKIAVQYPFVTLPQIAFADAKNLAAILPDQQMHIIYSGALGYKQNSHKMVAMMQAAAERFPHMQFHVFSGGPFFDELKAQYEHRPGPRVQFHPLVAEQDLAELYARSAMQIIPQAEGTEAGALPSKLPNLLAAGVHLLAICSRESEVGRLIQQAGTGTLVEQWDESLFLKKLTEAAEVVTREPAQVRQTRVQPLLPLFSVDNLVQMAIAGRTQEPAPTPIPAEELAISGGVRG